ncbi:hypothetical protein [Cellulomonas sp. URHB0016]
MTDTGQPGPDPAQRGTRPAWASTGAEAAASPETPPEPGAPEAGADAAHAGAAQPGPAQSAPSPYLGYRAGPAPTPAAERTPTVASPAPAPGWSPPASPTPLAPAATPLARRGEPTPAPEPTPATEQVPGSQPAPPAQATPAAPAARPGSAAPPTLITTPVAQPVPPAQPTPPAEPPVLVAPDQIRYASRPSGRTVENSFGPAARPPLSSVSGDAPSASGGGEVPRGDAKPRPRWLLPAAIGVAVLVVIGVVGGILASRDTGGDDAPPPVATTVLLPSPTPSVEPVARAATTAFAAALPTSVLQYALATSEPYPDWQAAGAIEAYTETYSDGGSGTVSVQVGQWESADEAAAYAATLVAALPTAAAAPAPTGTASASAAASAPSLPQSGDVTAGGQKAGTYTIVDAGDGTGVAVWTNGTVVIRVVAPVDEVVDVYSAFPL